MISAKIIKLCLIIERYKYENYNEEDDKMPRLLSIEETINIIREYIEDDRKKQAILLNGEWGCGKTFFINNKLIPQINKNKFQIYQISLYGVSDIEKIQDLIYEKWIEKVVEDKTEKFDIVSDALIKRIELLGKMPLNFWKTRWEQMVMLLIWQKICLNRASVRTKNHFLFLMILKDVKLILLS